MIITSLIRWPNSLYHYTFIAIDEIDKYGKETKEKLENKNVVKLSNQDVLYIKDWREEKSSNKTNHAND